MPRRSQISLKPQPALTATRVALDHHRLVYVFVANRPLSYRKGRSRIVYIGTTKKGVQRISSSVATRAEKILRNYGVSSFEARVLTCRSRKHVKMWFKLERALLIEFRDAYGEIPYCNTQGSKVNAENVFDFFSRARVTSLIKTLSG